MTQEEKFEEAKRLYETANADQRYVLESLFPELRESEDERIKSAAIEFVIQNKSFNYYLGISKDDVVTWINRQGEKEYDWSEESYDDARLNDIVSKVECGLQLNKAEINWLKSLKDRVQPKQVLRDTFGYEDGRQFGKNDVLGNPEKYGLQRFAEWSKSDKEIVKEIDTIIHGTNSISDEVRKKLQDWLKSLRPQSQWKPSDEQMNNLEYISTHPSHIDYQNIEIIRSLYNDLKKLM